MPTIETLASHYMKLHWGLYGTIPTDLVKSKTELEASIRALESKMAECRQQVVVHKVINGMPWYSADGGQSYPYPRFETADRVLKCGHPYPSERVQPLVCFMTK